MNAKERHCDSFERRQYVLRHMKDIKNRHTRDEMRESIKLLQKIWNEIPPPTCCGIYYDHIED